MAVGILVVATTVAATAADANGVGASRVAWLSVALLWVVDARVAWLSAVSLGEAAVRVVACLEVVMRKEASQLGAWLVYSADWVCSQVSLRAGSSLHWAVWRIQA